MAQKLNLVRNKKITDAAKYEECTLNIAGVCSYNVEETVACHIYVEGGIMGGKTDDLSAVFGCYPCHGVIDQHKLSTEDELFYTRRGLIRTIKRLFEKGVLLIA
jgi:hypothetical protein